MSNRRTVASAALVVWLAACGNGTSPGTGTGGSGGQAGMSGGAAGQAGMSPGGTAGQGGASGGAAGQAGMSPGGAAGQAAGAPGAAGHAGSQAAGGGPGGAGGALAGCSPCHLAVRQAECIPPDGATCIEQQSTTKGADGTSTTIQNACFSDGTKSLEVDTDPNSTPKTVNRTVQVLRNGALCGLFVETSVSTSDDAGDTIQTDTEVITDSAGNLLATEVSKSIQYTGGGSFGSDTITCVGQAPEPFNRACLYGGLVSCTNGSCM